MTHFSGVINSWITKIVRDLYLIWLPGLVCLFVFDVNFNLFRGEFSLEDITNFNTIIMYYVEKMDITGQQTLFYGVVMGMIIYLLGYFLHASSKYFMGPKRFRIFLKVSDFPDAPQVTKLPGTAMQWLKLKEGDMTEGFEEASVALVETSGIPSHLPGFERRSNFFRALGYLFALMSLLDVALFLIAFDFSDIIIKLSCTIFNITFAFLFFKSQEECVQRWNETLAAETIVAAAKLTHEGKI